MIQTTIADKYEPYFQDQMEGLNESWDETITKKLLFEILQDGEIRFLLSIKYTNLRAKKRILLSQIISKSQELIDSFKANYKHTSTE